MTFRSKTTCFIHRVVVVILYFSLLVYRVVRMPIGKRSASTEDKDDGKSTTSKRSRRSESDNESDGRRDESANEEVRWTNVVDLRMELESIAEVHLYISSI